jgi:hypothetical protein
MSTFTTDTTTETPDVKAMVEKGVQKLNNFFGGTAAWTARVDVGWLDMSSGTRCILGQLFREYGNGLMVLPSTVNPIECGFVAGSKVNSVELTAEWKRRIREMRDPKVGDEVELVFRANWVEGGFSKNWTLSPFALMRVANVRPKPKPKPEPGDRVQQFGTFAFGTVLKPKNGSTPPNGSVRVQWDGGYATPIPSDKLSVVVNV